eukprot:11279388-Alexandrium_andersonii.AAC.1
MARPCDRTRKAMRVAQSASEPAGAPDSSGSCFCFCTSSRAARTELWLKMRLGWCWRSERQRAELARIRSLLREASSLSS